MLVATIVGAEAGMPPNLGGGHRPDRAVPPEPTAAVRRRTCRTTGRAGVWHGDRVPVDGHSAAVRVRPIPCARMPESRSPACPPPPPRRCPGYTLEAGSGRGGSGEVWRAVPRRGGPPVAVKVLVAGDPERQAREAALLGELDHPHLVRLLEVVHQPQRGRRRRAWRWSWSCSPAAAWPPCWRGAAGCGPGEVVTAIAPVAAALAHAHGNGVVHGDLSPGNIVFTAEGRPVLTDLGVARVLGETAAGEVTPAYVDPPSPGAARPGRRPTSSGSRPPRSTP